MTRDEIRAKRDELAEEHICVFTKEIAKDCIDSFKEGFDACMSLMEEREKILVDALKQFACLGYDPANATDRPLAVSVYEAREALRKIGVFE